MRRRPPILILQDFKENRRKCSLSSLRHVEGVEFRTVRTGKPAKTMLVEEGIILWVHAPVLKPEDRTFLDSIPDSRLILVDGNWARVPALFRSVTAPGGNELEPPGREVAGPAGENSLIFRALPRTLVSAYPRRSKLFDDPEEGLASVEALVAALHILGSPDLSLLEGYRWQDRFLELNRLFFERPPGSILAGIQ